MCYRILTCMLAAPKCVRRHTHTVPGYALRGVWNSNADCLIMISRLDLTSQMPAASFRFQHESDRDSDWNRAFFQTHPPTCMLVATRVPVELVRRPSNHIVIASRALIIYMRCARAYMDKLVRAMHARTRRARGAPRGGTAHTLVGGRRRFAHREGDAPALDAAAHAAPCWRTAAHTVLQALTLAPHG
jgi:hypothetical protein